jgi:hypothetical protein
MDGLAKAAHDDVRAAGESTNSALGINLWLAQMVARSHGRERMKRSKEFQPQMHADARR